MKKLFLFTFIIIQSFVACSDNVSINSVKRIAKTIEVKEISSNNHVVSMTAIAEWSNGCGEFSHYLVDKVNNDVIITVYGKEPSTGVCAAVMITFEAPINIVLENTGEYSFHFFQTDSTFLDTTFFVDF